MHCVCMCLCAKQCMDVCVRLLMHTVRSMWLDAAVASAVSMNIPKRAAKDIMFVADFLSLYIKMEIIFVFVVFK